jgi:hypothetical protein
VQCVHETGPGSKTSLKVLEFEKKVIKLEPKGSKFERTRFKPLPEEPPHKFFNVKTGPEVLSKRKNCTTLVHALV